MKRRLYIILCCLVATSCLGVGRSSASRATSATPSAPQVKFYDYELVASYPHSTDSYTQGLIYRDGELLEGTGLTGESRILRVDIASGESVELSHLGSSHFGEGIAILGDTLYQLTWVTNRLLLYDANSFERIGEKVYSGEGWGITTDGESLYTSDGSSIISVRDPQSFKVKRRMAVTFESRSVMYLNELEWIKGKIWANVYGTDQIAIINPESGVVEGVVELKGILPESEWGPETDVLNGIAYDSVGDRLFVTGKNWSKLFEIKIKER